MTDEVTTRCRVVMATDGPCTGSYSTLGPADPEPGEARFKCTRIDHVALRPGTYRVTFERVGD